MAFKTGFLNASVDGAVVNAAALSLHSDDPGDTGANELPAGTAGYTRDTPTWPAATNRESIYAASWNVSGGDVARYMGVWDSGGVFQGGFRLVDTAGQPVSRTSVSDFVLDVNARIFAGNFT